MYANIPRIRAKEWMDTYIVMIAANPYVERDARENILSSWRNLISGAFRKIVRAPGVEYLPDGTEVRKRRDVPLREVDRILRNAFGRAIRD
jgi:hypothetical protein